MIMVVVEERSTFCSQSNRNPSNYSWCHLNRFSINGLRIQSFSRRQQRTNDLMGRLLLFALQQTTTMMMRPQITNEFASDLWGSPWSSLLVPSQSVILIIRTYTILCLVKHTTESVVVSSLQRWLQKGIGFQCLCIDFSHISRGWTGVSREGQSGSKLALQ